jgi:hypothetical protein
MLSRQSFGVKALKIHMCAQAVIVVMRPAQFAAPIQFLAAQQVFVAELS